MLETTMKIHVIESDTKALLNNCNPIEPWRLIGHLITQ
jgi:hypothetical protein